MEASSFIEGDMGSNEIYPKIYWFNDNPRTLTLDRIKEGIWFYYIVHGVIPNRIVINTRFMDLCEANGFHIQSFTSSHEEVLTRSFEIGYSLQREDDLNKSTLLIEEDPSLERSWYWMEYVGV